MKKQYNDIPRNILFDLYINQQKSMNEISKMYGCRDGKIKRYLNHYNIPLRSIEKSRYLQGKKSSNAIKISRSLESDIQKKKRIIKAKNTINNKSDQEKQKSITVL